MRCSRIDTRTAGITATKQAAVKKCVVEAPPKLKSDQELPVAVALPQDERDQELRLVHHHRQDEG